MNDEQRAQIKRLADEGRKFVAIQTKIVLVEGEPIDSTDSDQVIAVLVTFLAMLIESESDTDRIINGDPGKPVPVGILHSRALKRAK